MLPETRANNTMSETPTKKQNRNQHTQSKRGVVQNSCIASVRGHSGLKDISPAAVCVCVCVCSTSRPAAVVSCLSCRQKRLSTPSWSRLSPPSCCESHLSFVLTLSPLFFPFLSILLFLILSSTVLNSPSFYAGSSSVTILYFFPSFLE